jgi:hypothetical protein
VHWQSLYEIMPVILQCDIAFLTCLGKLGQHDTTFLFYVVLPKVAKASKEGVITQALLHQTLLMESQLNLPRPTQTEMILSVLHHPRWPRQVRKAQYCRHYHAKLANGNTALLVLATLGNVTQIDPLCVVPPKVA